MYHALIRHFPAVKSIEFTMIRRSSGNRCVARNAMLELLNKNKALIQTGHYINLLQ